MSPAAPQMLDGLNGCAAKSMSQAAVANTVKDWFKDHVAGVSRTLKSYGVHHREDRADLTQSVFVSAYLALLRGDQIVTPGAWLWGCAKKHATNYHHRVWQRRAQLERDVRVHDENPEQLTSNRESVQRALAVLTEDQKNIVFDIRVDGVRWKDAANERGVTVEQARYMCKCAESQMVDALVQSGKAPF